MFKFNLYSLFGVTEKRISLSIESFGEQKRNLNLIIDDAMRFELIKRFPNRTYADITNIYRDDMNNIKNSLYRKYSNSIDLQINGLNLLKEQIKN